MKNKKKMILITSILLFLFLWTGYQMKTSYTTSDSTIPLYTPSNTTITDDIRHPAFHSPVVQADSPPLYKPIFKRQDQTKHTQSIHSSTYEQHSPPNPTKTERPPLTEIKKKPSTNPTKENLHKKSRPYEEKSSSKNPIWASLNNCPINSHAHWTETATKRARPKDMKKKRKAHHTMFSIMTKNTPDIKVVLGYTKR